MVNWNNLDTSDQLNELVKSSHAKPVLIFKHSTRCGVSLSAKRQFEREWQIDDASKLDCWYLDLLNNRELSAEIAARFQVQHESPQVLLLHNGTCVYAASHHHIDLSAIRAKLAA
jgi:bacillithiol system protein YtxJ